MTIKRWLFGRAARVAMMPLRLLRGFRAARTWRSLIAPVIWTFSGREFTNFSYDTPAANQAQLANALALLTGIDRSTMAGFVHEAVSDAELPRRYAAVRAGDQLEWMTERTHRFGKRLAYYALVRALRPRTVIEAGVDQGLGAMAIVRALEQNAAEGTPGLHFGIEFNRKKACPFQADGSSPYSRIVHARSEEFLERFEGRPNIFIHDTLSDADHVCAHLEILRRKMRPGDIFVAVWVLPEIVNFCETHDLAYVVHRDESIKHPYPGSALIFVRF